MEIDLHDRGHGRLCRSSSRDPPGLRHRAAIELKRPGAGDPSVAKDMRGLGAGSEAAALSCQHLPPANAQRLRIRRCGAAAAVFRASACRRVREQIGRVERQIAVLSKELDDAGLDVSERSELHLR